MRLFAFALSLLCMSTLFSMSPLLYAAQPAEDQSSVNKAQPNAPQTPPIEAMQIEQGDLDKPMYRPLIERYILDEIKELRREQQAYKAEVATALANSRLEISDRAISYTADTTNTIFYIITMAASILVLVGWRSLNEVKDNVKTITAKRVTEVTEKYQKRLESLEEKLKSRTDELYATQVDMTNNNLTHALWMRAPLEKTEQEKINVYDQILEINPEDIAALTSKADSLLDLGQPKRALIFAQKAIKLDNEHAMGFWQRACANAELFRLQEALEDLKQSLELAVSFKDAICDETHFKNLANYPEFEQLKTDLGSCNN